MANNKLTQEQIENWRVFMILFLGVKALYLSDAEVQQLRDEVDANFRSEGGSTKPMPLPFLRTKVVRVR
jgi:hypothetical protein